MVLLSLNNKRRSSSSDHLHQLAVLAVALTILVVLPLVWQRSPLLLGSAPQQQDVALLAVTIDAAARLRAGGGGGGGSSSSSSSSSRGLEKSLQKLYQQNGRDQVEAWDRTQPIYLDFGLSDAKDTAFHLSKGYSTISVDAFLPWIDKAKEKFADEIKNHRALFFNVGLGLDDTDEPMPLYFKEAGSVIASFVIEKGCQGAMRTAKCQHVNVPVVQCDAVIKLANAAAEIMKVDIEMLHHACVRSLHRVDTHMLPKHVCWEEHDKPFGEDKSLRPITDTKLILGLHELGYDGIKIVMQGPAAKNFYGLKDGQAGFGQGSGTLSPDEMMHYRSYEDNTDEKDGSSSFDTKWRTVDTILRQGVFSPGSNSKSAHFFKGSTYYDVCMKLSPNAAQFREHRTKKENFSLGSYGDLRVGQ